MKSENPAIISVIIPVYNVRPYLREAVDSVLNQSYRKLEVILVDDGSTDGSGRICDAYRKRDRRIQVIHQANRGLSAARNAGINLCRGEMIAFLDPDDAFHRDMLLKMSEAMLKSGADIVQCNFVTYHGTHFMDPARIKRKQKAIRKTDCAGLYLKKDAFRMQVNGAIAASAWNKLYRRKVWENLRFREGQNYEDIDLILPLLAEADRVFLMEEALVLHRKREGSITATNSHKNIRDRALAMRHYEAYARAHVPEYFTAEEIRKIAEKRYCSSLQVYFQYLSRRLRQRSRLSGTSDGKIRALLVHEIEAALREIDPAACGLRVRAGTWVYLNLPPSAGVLVYRIYRPFRILSKRVLSR